MTHNKHKEGGKESGETAEGNVANSTTTTTTKHLSAGEAETTAFVSSATQTVDVSLLCVAALNHLSWIIFACRAASAVW